MRGRSVRALVRPVARSVTRPVGSVRSVRTALPHVVLTFDDGPEPGGTDAVLSALAERGATATFFVLVDRARRHPALLDRVAAAGHEIGLHGCDHRRLTRLAPREVTRRCTEGRSWLERQLGRPVRWFRPPYGAQTPATWAAVRRSGLQPVVWGPTSWDWLDLPVPELARRATIGLTRGAILLSHDGFAADPDEPAPGPPPGVDREALTHRILDEIEGRGLQGRSLGEALRHGRADSWAWFRR